MAAHNRHAPWRKAVLVPFWCIQLFLELGFLALLGLAVGVLVTYKNDDYYVNNNTVVTGEALNKTTKIVIPVWMCICALCLILTVTEIILLARHKLKPLTFVVMNTIKSAIWAAIFVMDIIAAVDNSSRTASAIALLIEGILLLAFWIPLIYGSVIYHRSRKTKRSYKPVEHPLSTPGNEYSTEYPSQYKQFIADEQQRDVEAQPMTGQPGGRRLSYNHQRDTRFEAYRAPSYHQAGDIGMGSPDIPQVHVEHHDGELYEMESSRKNLR